MPEVSIAHLGHYDTVRDIAPGSGTDALAKSNRSLSLDIVDIAGFVDFVERIAVAWRIALAARPSSKV